MKRFPCRRLLISTTLCVAWPLSALAQSSSQDIDQARATMSRLIGLLNEQGVLSREKAEGLLKEVAPQPQPVAAAGKAAGNTGTVRVQYVPQVVRDEIKQELRSEMAAQAAREGWAGPGAVPAWVRGVSLDGDLRVRLQSDRFADGNAPAVNVSETNRTRAVALANTSEDRTRLRVRARVGVTATLDEKWSAGLRISTGSGTDPLSANQTLGNFNNRFTIGLDRAYVRWHQGAHLNAVAGRFGNPWFGTDLVWANDLSFDGAALQWTPAIGSNARGFLTVAAMPVQEVELSGADKWLFGAQIGAEMPRLFGAVSAKFGVGLYSYRNTVGKTSPASNPTRNDFTAPAFAQKGNTYYNIATDATRPLLGLAADYRLVNLTGAMSMAVLGNKRVVLNGDYVKNIGFDRKAVLARAGVDVQPQTTGWQLRLAFGSPEVAQLGDWQVFAGYKRLERDAVPDAFTDSDFRLGGTDAKGYILGGSYGLGKNTAMNVRLLSADSISGPPLSVDVLQLDLNLRF